MEFVRIYKLDEMKEEDKKKILDRGKLELKEYMEKLGPVVDDVRRRGDEAVKDYTEKFDGAKIERLEVGKDELREAYKKTGKELVESIKRLAANVEKFHMAQRPKEMWSMEVSPGLVAGQRAIPIERVGCYAPGGRGWFPSTALMTVIPAKVAGCDEIVMCSPPDPKTGTLNPATIVAGDIAGATRIFKIGGAQSIAAMAYGTESVPKVYKIVGPGGIWILAAKKLVESDGAVTIDCMPGPGEGLILCDDSANPRFVGADILIQAEHGDDSAGIVVTDSMDLARAVKEEAEKQVEELPEYRKNFVVNSISARGGIIVAKNMENAIAFVNEYAVEHLEIQTRNPMQTMLKIRNAGAFYLGDYSPLSAGCFCSGPNHTLPTAQNAKMFGGLSTEDFMKKVTFEFPTKDGLRLLKDDMVRLADYEGFPAHRNAIKRRFE